MSLPLVSVVIPTCARPQFLPAAVSSALESTDDEIEIIVVPNGPDQSWMRSMTPFRSDQRVRVEPIAKAHANTARNYGLMQARGKYVRFLDDDDLLCPGASAHQCELLEASRANICSGAIDLVDADCIPFQVWDQPATDDFVESILVPQRVAHLAAHVFRTTALAELHWDESIRLGQDTHWMHQLCQHDEWPWVRTDNKVGLWRHHTGARISASSRQAQHLKVSVQYLLQTIQVLHAHGRLRPKRKIAAAAGLWHYVHSGFFMEPSYWITVLREAQRLFPGTYPDVGLYRYAWGKAIPPLLLESLMLPKRRINHGVRLWKFKHGQLDCAVPP